MLNKLLLSAICVSFLATTASRATAQVTDKAFEKKFEQYLASESGSQALSKFLDTYMEKRAAKTKAEMAAKQNVPIEEQLKNPVKVALGNSPSKGPKDAKITIVEFSDFQCPFCSRGSNTVEEVIKAYPGQVRVVFKNLPLPFHKQAIPAAKAALAANEQGRFWEFHDELFANQKTLNDEFYVATAQKLGLNVERFKRDLADPKLDKQIEEDLAEARKHGLTGTPAFFVNGVTIKGARPVEYFKEVITKSLAASKS